MRWRGGRRRRWVILGVATVVVVGAAATIASLWPRDRARAVDTDTAVERYRAATTVVAVATSAARVAHQVTTPAPGVYQYATTGTESVDLLGGATHQYPARTTLTVHAGGCGVVLRWDLLVERYDEWQLCAGPDGIELGAVGGDYHEFFGTGRHQMRECDRPLLLVPADGAPRPAEPWQCTVAGAPWPVTWEVLEHSTITVGKEARRATHVRMTVAIDGHYFDDTVVEWWLDDDGLPLSMRATRNNRADSGVIGDVVYTEQVQADLLSLEPLT